MNCLAWPRIFKGNATNVLVDRAASEKCLHLLLLSEARELFGDPDFGIKLKKYTFEQNNYILKDILIDELYTKIRTLCPQIYLERKDIVINQVGNKLVATINCINRADFSVNSYNLVLFEQEE